MRRFVIVGQTAHASASVRLDDLPGTSGRLDVLVRCVRAALLYSHGVRRDVTVDLVLLGGTEGPRTVRVAGAEARFVRPDERPLATLLMKALARHEREDAAFAVQRTGIAVASAGLEAVIADLGGATPFVLEEGAPDVRGLSDEELTGDAVFFLGDHSGFDEATRLRLAGLGARPIAVGPVSLHTDDVVAVLTNEIDRRRRVA